jgi:hypothetical protein
MTLSEQLAYFEKLLVICEVHGWLHLAELIYQQYLKLRIVEE